jgi:hypothetical protein
VHIGHESSSKGKQEVLPVRLPLRSVLVSAGLLATAAIAPVSASAGNAVNIIVLREHSVGTPTTVQPFLDKFVAIAAKENSWDPASKGKYETTRAGASAYVKSDGPHYGIFSLAAFLELRGPHNMDPVGSATLSTLGGQQYFIVSKSAADINGCKGKRLASDHLDDPKFIEKVVLAGAAKLSDFTLVQTTRPVQTIKKVVNDDAECALIDDAQNADLKKMASDPAAAAVKQAWAGAVLPPMPVVAFPSAPAAEKTAFQTSLPKLCPSNQQVCTDAGIKTLTTAGAAEYANVVALYNKP